MTDSFWPKYWEKMLKAAWVGISTLFLESCASSKPSDLPSINQDPGEIYTSLKHKPLYVSECVFKIDFGRKSAIIPFAVLINFAKKKNIGPVLCTAQTRDGGQRVKSGVKAPAQHHGARYSRDMENSMGVERRKISLKETQWENIFSPFPPPHKATRCSIRHFSKWALL